MENSEQEIIAFAVPVFWNNIVMPLGLTMPISRCSSAERKKIIEQLKTHADCLSHSAVS